MGRDGSIKRERAGLVTRRELAKRLGCHIQSITRWERDGLPCAQPGGGNRASLFAETDVRAWLAAREAAARESGVVDLARERARRERAQAMVAEQLYATRAGKLLDADAVHKKWTEEITAARAVLLASHQSAADRIYRAAITGGLAGVERELGDLARAVLRELAGEDHPKRDASSEPTRRPLATVNGHGGG